MVEFLPVITNIYDAVSGLDKRGVNDNLRGAASHPEVPAPAVASERMQQLQMQRDVESPSPASEELGQRRILRTSPLTEVPFVCCPSS